MNLLARMSEDKKVRRAQTSVDLRSVAGGRRTDARCKRKNVEEGDRLTRVEKGRKKVGLNSSSLPDEMEYTNLEIPPRCSQGRARRSTPSEDFVDKRSKWDGVVAGNVGFSNKRAVGRRGWPNG